MLLGAFLCMRGGDIVGAYKRRRMIIKQIMAAIIEREGELVARHAPSLGDKCNLRRRGMPKMRAARKKPMIACCDGRRYLCPYRRRGTRLSRMPHPRRCRTGASAEIIARVGETLRLIAKPRTLLVNITP